MQTLRELAKSYEKGDLNEEQYRTKRAALINGLLAGETAIYVNNFRALLDPIEKIRQRLAEQEAKQQTTEAEVVENEIDTQHMDYEAEDEESSRINKPLMLSLLLLILLGSAAGYYYQNFLTDENNILNDIFVDNEVVIPSADTASVKAKLLITRFLDSNDWSEQSIKAFTENWYDLELSERYYVRESNRMQRLHKSIYKQFLEAKALASVDTQRSILKQQQLIDFVAALGIDDPRFVIE